MKNKMILIVVGVFIVGFLLGGGAVWKMDHWIHSDKHYDGHDHDAQGDSHAPVENGHSNHAEDEHKDLVQLTDEEMAEYGIEIATVSEGKLQTIISLSGEVVPNPDKLAHIVPPVSGIARQIGKSLGDKVVQGEFLAVIESRELAEAKSAYLADRERLALAEAKYLREEKLWKQEISSEQEFLDAKQAFAEARINLITSEQKLHAIGFSDDYLGALPNQSDQKFTRYEILAPFDGIIIDRHIAIGERLKDDSIVFTIADLDTVWVNLTVYQRDLESIHAGQQVLLASSQMHHEFKGIVDYVSPIVDEATRTATARVVVDNREGVWRPGVFITAEVDIDAESAALVLPRSALQNFEGRTVVFVKTWEGFVPQPVEVGRMDRDQVEILSGMDGGEDYVVSNAFVLKSELEKNSFGHGHAH